MLCCDDLPENGALLRAGLLGFARRTDPDLAAHIGADVAFRASMADRITAAATDETRALAARLTGFADAAAMRPSRSPSGWSRRTFPGPPRPGGGGAVFVDDVALYERMKLRMLNGTHSMGAHAGVLAGHRYVRGLMSDADLARLVRRHMAAAQATLAPLTGIDLDRHAEDPAGRFDTPAIASETHQIAMTAPRSCPALEASRAPGDVRPFAFAVTRAEMRPSKRRPPFPHRRELRRGITRSRKHDPVRRGARRDDSHRKVHLFLDNACRVRSSSAEAARCGGIVRP